MAESPNNTLVLKPTDPPIVDAKGVKWTFNKGGRVTFNGTVDFNTANVIELAYENHIVYQKNTAGEWYKKTTTSWAQVFTDPTTPVTPPPTDDTLTVVIAAKITDQVLPKFVVALGKDGDVVTPITSVNVAADNVHWQTITFTGRWPSPQKGYLTFLNAANNRALVVKSMTFDANTYTANNSLIVLSGQGDSASFSR